MDAATRETLSRGIARICRETLGAAPSCVELHGGDAVVLALLADCLPPAEEALAGQPGGRDLLRAYHDACSHEIRPALAYLVLCTTGRELRSVALEPVRETCHKLLVLVVAAAAGPASPPDGRPTRQEDPR